MSQRPRNRFRSFHVTILLCILHLLVACKPKSNARAVGNWQAKDSKETIEFRSDGTCHGVDEYGRVVTGSFTLLDDERFRIDLTTRTTNSAGNVAVDRASGVCKLLVKRDSLTLIDPAGMMKSYQKVK